jgi:hypothetical protein
VNRREALFLALFFLLTLGFTAGQVHSFDIFWQLQTGKFMLESGSFLRQDLFTLASDAPRYEHCWLHDVIFYGIYVSGGYIAISLAKGILLNLTLMFLVFAARMRGASWWAIWLLVPVFFLTRHAWLERPQLWSFLCFSLTVLILERFLKRPDRSVFWLLPVMVCWANLHAGAVLLVPLLAAYLVGSSLEWSVQRDKKNSLKVRYLLILLGGGVVSLTMTPEPLALIKTLVGAPVLGDGSSAEGQAFWAMFNMDWRPTTWAADGVFFMTLGLASVICLAGWRRLRWSDAMLLLGLALMGFKLSRHTTFLMLAMIAIIPVYLSEFFFHLRKKTARQISINVRFFPWVVGACLWGVTLFPVYSAHGWYQPGLREWHYPLAATEFLISEKLPANIYNTYDWGGYLAWQAYPEYHVFWDGRQNSKDKFKQGWMVMAGKPGWDAVLEQNSVNTIVTRCCTMDTGQLYPLIDLLRFDPGWSLVYAGRASLVFVRKSAVSVDWLADHELPSSSVDDTILSEATLHVQENPDRYLAWMALVNVHLKQRNFKEAFIAIKAYLKRSPVKDPVAEKYYENLCRILGEECLP